MKQITITIDNKKIQAQEGQTILQAAEEQGISIPHLCFDPRLEPFTSCWLCVVEIKGFPKLVPSCTAKITEGMEITTQSERIREARQMCLSLLLSDHYGDCIAPCQNACPDHIDIQGYLALAALGKYREALELIREVNPLPLCVGRVCPRFCERECRRNLVDEPVGINFLKRFVSEHAYEGINPSQVIPENTGFRVAIIGAGPAGLAAAHFLRLQGHAVTIFEANPNPGGMMRYGIPEYRLPKKEMDKEIKLISDMGVKIKYGQRFGKDIDLNILKSQGFAAILIALGAWSERKLGCEGEEIEGVVSGIGLLYSTASGEKIKIGKKVSVIGGGNTAIDAARTCLRLGAEEAHLIYRRSREEMPALSEEVHEAELEGVQFHFLSAPVRVKEKDGKASSIECIRMELGAPDASGRRSPVPVSGSEYEFQTDMVVAAIGQFMGDQDALKGFGIPITRRGTIEVNPDTMQTRLGWVFAAGDCVSGPATVIEAIAGGRKASEAIDTYLRKGATTEISAEAKTAIEMNTPLYNHTKGDLTTIDKIPFESYQKIPRSIMPALSKEERLKDFTEVEQGLSEEQARKEAERCLVCGCEAVFDCKLREYATTYHIAQDEIQREIQRGKLNRYLLRDEHAFIFRDRNKCIRCGLCVRICSEVEGTSAFGFVGRGFQTTIDPPLDLTLRESACDSCGLCLSACPTGSLEYRTDIKRIGPWKPVVQESVCTLCNIGCEILVKRRAGYCLEIAPKLDGSRNQGKLCWKGVFGWTMLHSPKRITHPYINKSTCQYFSTKNLENQLPLPPGEGRGDGEFYKKEGNLQREDNSMAEASWDDAIAMAGEALKEIIKNHGPESVGMILSPRLSCEELMLLNHFARALCIKEISMPGETYPTLTLIAQERIASYQRLMESDYIICIGSEMAQQYPVISYMIKKKLKSGCMVSIVGKEDARLTDLCDFWADIPPDEQNTFFSLMGAVADEAGLLSLPHDAHKERISSLNEHDRDMLERWIRKGEMKKFVENLLNAERPVVIVNRGIVHNAALSWFLEGIWEGERGAMSQTQKGTKKVETISLISDWMFPCEEKNPHIKFLNLSRYGGNEILWDDKNGMEFTSVEDMRVKVEEEKIKALLIFGHWKGIERMKKRSPKTLFIQTAVFYPGNGYKPDFLFPASVSLESGGSFLNAEGELTRISAVTLPPAGKITMDFVGDFAESLDVRLPFTTIDEMCDVFVENLNIHPHEAPSLRDTITLPGKTKNKMPTADWLSDEIDLFLEKEIGNRIFKEVKP